MRNEYLNYNELLASLEKFIEWLVENKFDLPPECRLYGYGKLLTSIREKRQEHTKEEEYFGLCDLREFLHVYDAFKNDSLPSNFRSTMKSSLFGPVYTMDETGENNDARNKLFELRLAAHFKRAGIKSHLHEPDILLEFNNRKAWVACKRVISHKNVHEHVEKAVSQIGKRTRLDDDTVGIIALDITRIANSSHVIQTGLDALPKLNDQTDKQLKEYFDNLTNHPDFDRCCETYDPTTVECAFYAHKNAPCYPTLPDGTHSLEFVDAFHLYPTLNCSSKGNAIFDQITDKIEYAIKNDWTI